jgi:hypothetical protein
MTTISRSSVLIIENRCNKFLLLLALRVIDHTCAGVKLGTGCSRLRGNFLPRLRPCHAQRGALTQCLQVDRCSLVPSSPFLKLMRTHRAHQSVISQSSNRYALVGAAPIFTLAHKIFTLAIALIIIIIIISLTAVARVRALLCGVLADGSLPYKSTPLSAPRALPCEVPKVTL